MKAEQVVFPDWIHGSIQPFSQVSIETLEDSQWYSCPEQLQHADSAFTSHTLTLRWSLSVCCSNDAGEDLQGCFKKKKVKQFNVFLEQLSLMGLIYFPTLLRVQMNVVSRWVLTKVHCKSEEEDSGNAFKKPLWNARCSNKFILCQFPVM